jgi:hypothetical protein
VPDRFPLIESANKGAYPTVTGKNAVHAVQRRGIREGTWRGKGSDGKSSVTRKINTRLLSLACGEQRARDCDNLVLWLSNGGPSGCPMVGHLPALHKI